MEEDRSRLGNGGKRRRAAGGDVGNPSTTTEDEVEEFFAILRRIRTAARQIGGGRQATEKGARWKPTFEWEDFQDVNGFKTDGGVETVTEEEGEKKKKSKGDLEGPALDLNVEPNPECTAHFS